MTKGVLLLHTDVLVSNVVSRVAVFAFPDCCCMSRRSSRGRESQINSSDIIIIVSDKAKKCCTPNAFTSLRAKCIID